MTTVSVMIYESLGACFSCRIHGSLLRVVSWMIFESQGLFALSNPCVTSDNNLLMISESVGVIWAVESMCRPWEQFRKRLFALSNPFVNNDSSLVDDFGDPRGLWQLFR